MKRLICLLGLFFVETLYTKPKLTVIIVIDQFAAHYLPKLSPYWSHGLHTLLNNGIVYTNAYLPYAGTSTAVGHTSLGTGALPSKHGVVYNEWFDKNNKEIVANTPKTASLIMLPTLSNAFNNQKNNISLALSYKDRAAFGMAGPNSPVIWFNEKSHEFNANTNSLAVNQLLQEFNNRLKNLKNFTWTPAYSDLSYYQFPYINDYRFTRDPSMVGETFTKLEDFKKMPQANELLFDMAYDYIKNNMIPDQNMLVSISASSLDKIGHIYGPHSKEIIDMLYHLDIQIQNFINNLETVVNPEETLIVLTADHGVMPMPELVKNEHPTAQRLSETKLIKTINDYAQKTFNIPSLVLEIKGPHIFVNEKLIPTESHDQILESTAKFIEQLSGIAHVYTSKYLHGLNPPKGSVPWLLKNSIYPGRNGALMLETDPYVLISDKLGTKHYGPQDYNTRVPLALYQPKHHEGKKISSKVWMPQITQSLAEILEIQPPSHAMLKGLPT